MAPINKITRKDVEEFGGSLDEYQRIATQSAFYPGQGTALGLVYVGLKLNGEAGELAEHIGKAMRDDGLMPVYDATKYREGYATETPHEAAHLGGTLKSARMALVIKELSDVLWYLSAACNELGIKLSEVAATNLEKLCDRGERDALRGSGDDR